MAGEPRGDESRVDQLVQMRAADKRDLYVHQAERHRGGCLKNWNVIALILDSPSGWHVVPTDCRKATGELRPQRRVKDSVVERYTYTPYGVKTEGVRMANPTR